MVCWVLEECFWWLKGAQVLRASDSPDGFIRADCVNPSGKSACECEREGARVSFARGNREIRGKRGTGARAVCSHTPPH